MAPPKKDTPLRSPLVSAFSNIVNINRSKSQMKSTQASYSEFLRFMTYLVVEGKVVKAANLVQNRVQKQENQYQKVQKSDFLVLEDCRFFPLL